MAQALHLYLWEGVLSDYTDGVAFALAATVEEARLLIASRYLEDWKTRQHQSIDDPKNVGSMFRENWIKTLQWLEEITPESFLEDIFAELKKEPKIIEESFGFYLYGGG